MIKHRWFSPEEWKWLQHVVPITCVDILPVRHCQNAQKRDVLSVGLILRDTPHQGRRWCLIGGRLCHGEPLRHAIRRQTRETLGRSVRPVLKAAPTPLYVAEYSPSGKYPFLLDPRQHSVGLTYALEIRGVPVPTGEAIRFKWFEVESLPAPKQFGFGQDRVVAACVKQLRSQSSAS